MSKTRDLIVTPKSLWLSKPTRSSEITLKQKRQKINFTRAEQTEQGGKFNEMSSRRARAVSFKEFQFAI